MAVKKSTEATLKTYVVKIENNPKFCGEGAGGAQFAHGQATINSERLASWFEEHDGYIVEKVKEAVEK